MVHEIYPPYWNNSDGGTLCNVPWGREIYIRRNDCWVPHIIDAYVFAA
jgi:hypothetical protein